VIKPLFPNSIIYDNEETKGGDIIVSNRITMIIFLYFELVKHINKAMLIEKNKVSTVASVDVKALLRIS
jgi:hypothetical protein